MTYKASEPIQPPKKCPWCGAISAPMRTLCAHCLRWVKTPLSGVPKDNEL